MTNTTEHPRVFISYSWSTPEHEAFVVDLATTLRDNGVDAILDKFDLKEGQDKYVFMESMVTDPKVTKVLVLSDRKYAEKADVSPENLDRSKLEVRSLLSAPSGARRSDEEEQVHRRADRLRAAAG